MPVPADMVGMPVRNEAKQKDLSSANKPLSGTPLLGTSPIVPTGSKTSMSTTASPQLLPATITKSAAAASGTVTTPSHSALAHKKVSPFSLSPIPPFNSAKVAAAKAAKAPSREAFDTSKTPNATISATKMDAAAPAFVFRPGAATFTPGGVAPAPSAPALGIAGSSATAGSSMDVIASALSAANTPAAVQPTPQPQPQTATQSGGPLNPFFGARTPKSPNPTKPVHVKEDFSPFKRAQSVPDPASVKPEWGFNGKSFRSTMLGGSSQLSPLPPNTTLSHVSPTNVVSPQVTPALPTHILTQQHMPQQHVGLPPHYQHQHHQSNASNVSNQGVRNHQVRSPPPFHHMSRSPSSASAMPIVSPLGLDEVLSQKPITPASIPPSNLTQTGAPVQQGPPNGSHPSGQNGPHLIPQGYAMFQPHHFPGGSYRFAPGGPPQQPGQTQQSQPGAHQLQHIALQHNGHMPYLPQQGFIAQMPYSPQGMHASQPMFSPQLAGQMPPGREFIRLVVCRYLTIPIFLFLQNSCSTCSSRSQAPEVARHPRCRADTLSMSTTSFHLRVHLNSSGLWRC